MAEDLICGRQAARALDRSLREEGSNSHSISRIYLADNFPSKLKGEFSALLGQATVQTVTSAQLSRMTPLRHQGIIVQLKGGTGANVRSERSLKEALEERPGLYVMLDRIQDEQNLGSIIRSAEALGAAGMIITGKGARPGSIAARVSAGASMLLPMFVQSGSQPVIKLARGSGYWIIGTDSEQSVGPEPLDCNDLESLPDSDRFILIIGSEGDGMKRSLETDCDFVVQIPLPGKTASLNAGVAAGILIQRLVDRMRSSGPRPGA